MTTSSTTSLSGLGLSGLSSGLDTSGIITKLMAIEAQPQNQLKSRLSNVSTYRNALQSVNTQLAAIATAAKTASTAGSLTAFTASSDTAGITAAAAATASAGSVSFTVGKVAAAQTSVTSPMTTWPDTFTSTPQITIKTGSGEKTVTASSSNLDDVVEAINGGNAGVTATKIAAGADNQGVPQYRLQLRSSTTGAAAAFTAYEGKDSATGTALTVTNVTTAQDASITLYGGTGAEQAITSATNTFTGLMTGVDVTVSTATTSPATITVNPDSSKAASTASALSGSLIAFFSTIATDTAVTTSSSTSGGTSSSSTSGSVFTGDTGIRALNDQMLSAATDAVSVNGTLKSPSSIGITLTKTGTVSFDQRAFTSAMESDPTGTMAMFQTIATRISTAASAASDPLTGTLTLKITSEQSQESSLSSQISDWDSRLAQIQQTYQKQFTTMETALNNLSSQASWLTGQINSLPSYSSSSTSKNG
jgi:flagellar hook-associated protein 2